MSQPGPPGSYPGQHYHQPYLQQGGGWGQQPPPRKKKTGLLITMLALGTVMVLGLAFGGYWFFIRKSDSDGPPPVDASQDLAKAPIGCALFDKSEVAPYIPGRTEFKALSGDTTSDSVAQGHCLWGNTDTFLKDKVRAAHVIVTSYVYRATRTKSGVDAATEHLKRQVRNGSSVKVKDADEALVVEQGKRGHSVAITARYRNVVYHVDYTNQTDGAPVKDGVTALATAAIGKVALPG
ncbi:hypothetical protein DMH03_25955 [Amycolatopsis sp. WAC 01376]|uniref:hypothetical protein n=1 Tax=Amycolatopsis sp. WAC 01376 TaxID=2203195 RepID=UPI000F77B375|nr:hypothetical protein [Amycolatopsis sp. WAC 01376]RSM59296.1 hypothetical protein DMH03_25955 [Amycolatopsis sp. WAC 01376]